MPSTVHRSFMAASLSVEPHPAKVGSAVACPNARIIVSGYCFRLIRQRASSLLSQALNSACERPGR